jgi:rubredoxin
MCFVAHLPVDDGAVEVFMCQNDPGMCDDWDAESGGNRAVLVHGDLRPVAPPEEGETLLDTVTALRPVATPIEGEVPGRRGGTPDWWQLDETPACPACGRRMPFVAQLEEGGDALNFGGGGRGYVFTCPPCGTAAFLWQR